MFEAWEARSSTSCLVSYRDPCFLTFHPWAPEALGSLSQSAGQNPPSARASWFPPIGHRDGWGGLRLVKCSKKLLGKGGPAPKCGADTPVRCRCCCFSPSNATRPRVAHPCAFCSQQPALSEVEGVGFPDPIQRGIFR